MLGVWDELCGLDRILGSGRHIEPRRETVASFVSALLEPYAFEEEIPDLALAASDLLTHAGTGGLASRQLLALGEAITQMADPSAGHAIRHEFDRRLRVVLGRFMLYVNVEALGAVDLQARRDALTGLRNKREFDLDSEKHAAEAQPFAVAFVDVDGLKQVNDNHGHKAGDELLRQVAAALAESCAGGEYAYRFGGDEYAYLSTVRSGAEVRVLMAELSTHETPFSYGVAEHPADALGLEAAIGLADKRMYDCKRARKKAASGGASIVVALRRFWNCLRSQR